MVSLSLYRLPQSLWPPPVSMVSPSLYGLLNSAHTIAYRSVCSVFCLPKYFSKLFFPTYGIPMATQFELRNEDLDSLLKTQLIQLCRDNGLPTGSLKSSLLARLLTLRSQLPPLPASSATATVANAGSQQAFGFPQTASAGLPATPAVSAIAASLSAGVPRLPAPSTHAGPSLSIVERNTLLLCETPSQLLLEVCNSPQGDGWREVARVVTRPGTGRPLAGGFRPLSLKWEDSSAGPTARRLLYGGKTGGQTTENRRTTGSREDSPVNTEKAHTTTSKP